MPIMIEKLPSRTTLLRRRNDVEREIIERLNTGNAAEIAKARLEITVFMSLLEVAKPRPANSIRRLNQLIDLTHQANDSVRPTDESMLIDSVARSMLAADEYTGALMGRIVLLIRLIAQKLRADTVTLQAVKRFGGNVNEMLEILQPGGLIAASQTPEGYKAALNDFKNLFDSIYDVKRYYSFLTAIGKRLGVKYLQLWIFTHDVDPRSFSELTENISEINRICALLKNQTPSPMPFDKLANDIKKEHRALMEAESLIERQMITLANNDEFLRNVHKFSALELLKRLRE